MPFGLYKREDDGEENERKEKEEEAWKNTTLLTFIFISHTLQKSSPIVTIECEESLIAKGR